MSAHETVNSFEYKNDYLYIVIRQFPDFGPEAYAYCCGINISRFDPVSWRKAGICPNPACRSLQMLRVDVSAFAGKLGATSKSAPNIPCAPMTPSGDRWYRETTLLITGARPKAIRKILDFSVTDLVKKVLSACAPGEKIPSGLPSPPALQTFLNSLSAGQAAGPAAKN